MLVMSSSALAIPIYEPKGPPGLVFDHWETKRYWSWHGKARKYVPVFKDASPVPEPSTYIMMLSGLALVTFKVRQRIS